MFGIDNNTIALFVIALINFGGYIVLYIGNNKTQQIALDTKEITKKTELNTNSMREQLVKAEKTVSHAEGKEEAKIEGELKANTLALGQYQGRHEQKNLDKKNDNPVPVADDRTATASERSADATERIATAAEEVKKT